MPYHNCPAQGCTKKVAHNELACPRHWTLLPWRMRTNLTEAWRLNDRTAHQAALEAALDWYATHDINTAPESRGGHTTTTLEAGTITTSHVESGSIHSYAPDTSSSSSSDSGSSFGGGE